MQRILDKLTWLNNLQAPFIGVFGMVAGYFDSTITFLYALMAAFLFNILAGMRADNVAFKSLNNFKLPKFKDSLSELLLITSTTYFLKGIMDLMKHDEKSVYAVQILTWIALYHYFKKGLRNLSKAYPRNLWLRTVYHLISFQFTKMIPDSVNKAMEKAEEEQTKILDNDRR